MKIPDNVGVDQAPDLRFAFFEIAVKTGILQGDRGLRRKQFQHRDPRRSENVGGQVVFQVKQTDQFGLVNQRQAENGTGVMPTDVRIGGKRILG